MSTARQQAVKRRTFVKEAGTALLMVRWLGSTARAASPDLVIESGPGAWGHVHELAIPYSTLEKPPNEGIDLTSSRAFLHNHRIALSKEELTMIREGKTVNKKGGSHWFVVALPVPRNS